MTKFLELDEQSVLAAKQLISQEPQRLEDVAADETEPPESSAVALSPPQTAATEPPYEVCQQGSLTYFHYYFNAPDPNRFSAPRIDRSTKPNYLAPGLVGAGVLTATVVSGVFIANAVSDKPVTPTNNSTPDSQVKQTTTQKLPKPTTTAPEKLSQPEMLSSKPSQVAPALSPDELPPKPDFTATQIAQALNAPPVAIAAPETFGFGPLSPSQMEAASQPTRSQAAVASPPPVGAPAAPPASAGEPANPPTNPSVPADNLPAPAAEQPNFNAPSPAPNLPLQPPAQEPELPALPMQPVSSDRSPAELEAESSARSNDSTTPATQAENPATDLNSGMNSSLNSNLNPNINSSLNSNLNPNINSSLNPSMTPVVETNSSSQLPASPQTLEEFISLAQAKGIEVKLMSLTQQAASEVKTTNQVGAFTVRKLSPEEYLKEWQVSSNTPIEATNRFVVPTYGFIDYQRQIIAVVQEAPNAESLKSASR